MFNNLVIEVNSIRLIEHCGNQSNLLTSQCCCRFLVLKKKIFHLPRKRKIVKLLNAFTDFGICFYGVLLKNDIPSFEKMDFCNDQVDDRLHMAIVDYMLEEECCNI